MTGRENRKRNNQTREENKSINEQTTGVCHVSLPLCILCLMAESLSLFLRILWGWRVHGNGITGQSAWHLFIFCVCAWLFGRDREEGGGRAKCVCILRNFFFFSYIFFRENVGLIRTEWEGGKKSKIGREEKENEKMKEKERKGENERERKTRKNNKKNIIIIILDTHCISFPWYITLHYRLLDDLQWVSFRWWYFIINPYLTSYSF